MSKIKSLQYLLLDSLSKRDAGLSKKLSKTLSVSENNSYYIINWQDDRNLKKLEIEGGFGEAIKDKETGKVKQFFNLGPENDWKKLLDDRLIDSIEKEFETEMRELGYI